jgi:hypothetical protein
MTSVASYSRTHSVTYVADNILKSLKDIIRLSGLDPTFLVNDWDAYMRGVKTWLDSEHLDVVKLEIYDPSNDNLVLRWDVEVVYSSGIGEGTFWADTEQIKFHVRKAGLAPERANYRVILHLKPGAPQVEGWCDAIERPVDGMVKQSLGSTIEHHGLGANAAYWRRK